MKLTIRVLKTLLIYMFIFLILICIVLIPRDANYFYSEESKTGSDYNRFNYKWDLSWVEYYEKVHAFFETAIQEKSIGTTRYPNLTVEDEIKEYFPRSLLVILTAFVLSIIFGVWKGLYDFKTRYSKKMFIGQGLTNIFQSFPDFFLVIAIQWLIIYYAPFIDIFGHEEWYNFILPSLILTLYPAMYLAKITTSSLSNEEGKPYITTAKSQGLPGKIILNKHILRNCLGTIISHISTLMIYIISNLLIIEYLLDYKGAAYRLFQAFDIQQTVRPKMNTLYEGELIIGLAGCFILVILLAQVLSQVSKHFVEPH